MQFCKSVRVVVAVLEHLYHPVASVLVLKLAPNFLANTTLACCRWGHETSHAPVYGALAWRCHHGLLHVAHVLWLLPPAVLQVMAAWIRWIVAACGTAPAWFLSVPVWCKLVPFVLHVLAAAVVA